MYKRQTNNILRIKGINNHPTTNLTVITEEKNYYSFYVQFAPNPPLNYFISKEQRIHNIRTSPALVDIDKSAPHENTVSYNSLDQKGKTDNTNNTASSKQTSKLVALETAPNQVNSTKAPNRQTAIHSDFDEDEKEEKMNLASLLRLKQTAWEVLKDPSHHHAIQARHGDIVLKVTGVYHSLDYCYIKYEVKNDGAIPYDINYVEFGVREKKRPKRSALNEEKLKVITTLNKDITRVLPYRINRYVAVLPKLAVPKDRTCYMELIEEGRNIHLNIPYNQLKIPSIQEY